MYYSNNSFSEKTPKYYMKAFDMDTFFDKIIGLDLVCIVKCFF